MESEGSFVVDEVDRRARLLTPFDPSAPWTLVELDDEVRLLVRTQRMIPRAEGGFRLEGRFSEYRTNAAVEADARLVIPVVEERVRVETRRVETGRVRITKRVRRRTEVVDVPLTHEDVVVERVPINRFVEQAAPARVEGDTTVLPLYEEVVVSEKRLLLREEVRVTKRTTKRREVQRVIARREEATVERLAPSKK
jgi:uncharacterized protein (TIGR02271 family)